MAVSPEEVRHVARLARLRLEEDAVERLTHELNSILTHVDGLRGLESGSVEALLPAPAAPLRADMPDADALHRTVRDLAAAWDAGFFTVPRLAALDADATEDGP